MSNPVWLDREGDLPVPPGFQLIETEVDFLRWALAQQPLLIRGWQLCAWAEAFYALRNQPVRVVESPRSVLRRVFPNLSSEQAEELAKKIGKEHLSDEEISPVFVLTACFPNDFVLWQSAPSLQHAARWLLWLLEHDPSEAVSVILKKFASEMERQADESPVGELYGATNATEAKKLLWRWLGAEGNPSRTWGEFPIELPAPWLKEVKENWMKRIIQSSGKFFDEMLAFPLPLVLRRELAGQTAEYFENHAHQLTRPALQRLQPYLDPSKLEALRKILPPPAPDPLPKNETEVLSWFEHQYLPYRRWQASFGDETARQTAVQHAQTFARWLLERYPRWLLDSEYLSFQKSAQLRKLSNSLTLCVILDGLPAWDADWFAQELSVRAPRLTLLQKTYGFTALPTITEFAKEALLRGVLPRNASDALPLGEILPDKSDPKKHLAKAQAGEVWFWRVEQPDRAYHFEGEDTRKRRILGELQSILQAIQEVVETIPDNIPFNLLLTTDHGRLMNPRSPRQLPNEAGMQAHGRAAWGNFLREFPESGFIVNEKDGWVELYGERFGVEHNLRLAWGEESFATTNGTEAYPHGGLFPEEVIVPWFLFQRDAQLPALEITLTGTGEADMNGNVSVTIFNGSPLELECLRITFSHGAEISGNWKIPPLNQHQFTALLNPWPPKSLEGKVTASLLFSQPNGVTFTQTSEAALQIKVLYDQSDDLLKELGL
jgi:hypothetical protein